MAEEYLTEFYTYKAIAPDEAVEADDTSKSLEHRIQAHILAGNKAFIKEKYTLALNAYLTAWGLLPKVVSPLFPDIAVSVDDLQLIAVDLETPLLEASVQILRRRNLIDPRIPIISPLDPPPELVRIITKFAGKPSDPRQQYRMGAAFAQAGDFDRAEVHFKHALRMGGQNTELNADSHAALGTIDLARGNHDAARRQLEKASGIYKNLHRADGVAAMQHNIGVSFTQLGDVQRANKHFAGAAIHAPASLSSQVNYAFNPGINAILRPMGQTGLALFLKDADEQWFELPNSIAGKPRQKVHVVRNGAGIEIDLESDGVRAIREQLLEPRITVDTLFGLETYYWKLPQFVTYLSHVRGFILPMALGDTYFALGDYEKAAAFYMMVRDYPYLNQPIERLAVWRKLARTYLQRGNSLYRDQDTSGALIQYERIVKIVESGFELSGPLYSGGFASLEAETLDFLNAPDPLTYSAMDYERRMILLEALSMQRQIMSGINYLGFPIDIIPMHSWRYLQNVARYFANQAIQSERAYISFKNSAEKEEFTRLSLEQAVHAQAAALQVEERRVELARERGHVARLNARLAHVRSENAIEHRNDYASVSQEIAYLDEIHAFSNSSDRDVELSEDWASMLGIEIKTVTLPTIGEMTLDTFKGYYIVQLLTRKRNQLTRGLELRNMQRKIDELNAAQAVAEAQIDVADKMVEVANAQRSLAKLRLQQAQAQLEHFNSQVFTPELWDNLAQAQRGISQRYLDWAVAAAFLMERAFETEYDTDMNRIRFDYERSELHGLLAADFLLADIDQFSYDRLLEIEKQAPIKVTVALADRYPFQFYQQFQRTGRIDFETFLDDFDRWHPGTFLRKLRRVEVVVEGLIGPQGFHGTLTNSGISYYRDRYGHRQIRLQKPETMVLSRYDLRNDGFIFTIEKERVLAVFENSGVASGWILDFPPESNDVDYLAITNIHLIFYFDGYFDAHVANTVRAEMAAAAVYEYTLGLGLRFQFPDEFFGFQTDGEVTFTLDQASIPREFTDPRILDVHLVIETEAGTSAENLVINVTSNQSGIDINQKTDVNGMISTDATDVPMNALRGKPLLDTWTVRIAEDANSVLFNAGFTWEKVKNIYLYTEYGYTPKDRPTSTDNFSADPMAAFDVIDDPGAAHARPSNWSYDAPNQLVQQTSNIYGGASGTDPNKPGTYLIRKISAEWPEMRDLVLRCHMNSGNDDGIGLVFRYQDINNFYFFLMDAQRRYRRIGRKIAGVFKELETPAVDTDNGFNVDQAYEVTVAAVGDAIKAYLDGVEILSGRDQSLLQRGRVGMFAWANNAARFNDLTAQPV